MECKNCGKEIDDKAVVCVHCGVATDNFPKKEIYKPFIGFVLSFCSPLAGLIISIIEFNRAKANGGYTSLAFAGILISIGILSLIVILMVISILMVIFAALSYSDWLYSLSIFSCLI